MSIKVRNDIGVADLAVVDGEDGKPKGFKSIGVLFDKFFLRIGRGTNA